MEVLEFQIQTAIYKGLYIEYYVFREGDAYWTPLQPVNVATIKRYVRGGD